MNSPDHSTKGTPSRRPPGKTGRPDTLRLLVGTGVQALFHPPRGVLFTFPSRYSSTIGGWACLALEGGPPSFPQDFSCPAVLRNGDPHHAPVAYGTLTRCGVASQQLRLTVRPGGVWLAALQPRRHPKGARGLGCSRFARHYSRNTLFSSGYLDVSVPRVPRTTAMDLL